MSTEERVVDDAAPLPAGGIFAPELYRDDFSDQLFGWLRRGAAYPHDQGAATPICMAVRLVRSS